MTGGAAPFGLETENRSVKHWVACEAKIRPAASGDPPAFSLVTVVVEVDGPAIVKEMKSRRI